ncbi:sugar transferase [Alicyclobacillus sp. SO9]|uniref:sugar transferase n=1 Tax=Alicyclobacillus sp. SO9 TaxID=2665646 RepID=UPI0018E8140D|nr:sugar transferase [Alicyclobacillus sp. SO9]QQE78740.1 sugar transferase [Alicyclobacillus sp. SO9]
MDRLADNSRRLGFFLDILVVIFSFYTAYHIFGSLRGNYPFSVAEPIYTKTLLFSSLAWMSSLVLFSEYPVRRLFGFKTELWVVLRVNALALLFFSLLAFVLKLGHFSRLFIGLFFLTSIIYMMGTRVLVSLYLARIRRAGWDARTRIVVGSGEAALRYIENVEKNPRFGLRVLGIVTDEVDLENLGSLFLGNTSTLESVLTANVVDGVVIALPANHPYLERVIKVCEMHGITTELILDGLSSKIASSEIVHGMGVSRLVLSGIPHSASGLILKRATDVALATVGLVVVSPVLLVIALAIKLDDGGPVFFAQNRVGLHKQSFKMFKFRSMVVDAEERKKALQAYNEMSGPVFKMKNDPRITRMGRFLRKTSLDELPQLFNVLKGDMSLVGPRPPLPSEVDDYDYVHLRRLSVKPGITCTWQISGRNEIDFEQWMSLDLAYIDNWTFFSDVVILFKTIPAIFKKHGAF